MTIPSREIGWDQHSNLYWEISKQLESVIGIASKIVLPTTITSTTTTTTTTTAETLITIATTLTGDFIIELNGVGTCVITWPDASISSVVLTGDSNTITTKAIAGGGTITISNPEIITFLAANNLEITNITGQEYCILIQDIEFAGNLLTSFTTSLVWTNIQVLILYSNQLSSIDTFASWVNINGMELWNNSLTSFNTFATWLNISNLDVHNNLLPSFIMHHEWTSMGSKGGIWLDNNNLIETVVNNILIEFLASGMTEGTITLEGGTNASPTGAGITAADALVASGVTVTANGYP